MQNPKSVGWLVSQRLCSLKTRACHTVKSMYLHSPISTVRPDARPLTVQIVAQPEALVPLRHTVRCGALWKRNRVSQVKSSYCQDMTQGG